MEAIENSSGLFREIERRFRIGVTHLREVGSTNDFASAKNPFYHGDLIVADYQSRGRGQRGNRWKGERGSNLLFTLIAIPDGITPEEQFYLSKITAVSLAETLLGYGIPATIKWPNDVYVGDKKIAGILIENDLMGPSICKSMIGVGVNLNQRTFDPDLPNPTSFLLEKGCEVPRQDFLSSFLDRFFRRWALLTGRDFDRIDSIYKALLYRKTGFHPFREPDSEVFRARIADVNPTGELVLQKEHSGNIVRYLFKEIEFVMDPLKNDGNGG